MTTKILGHAILALLVLFVSAILWRVGRTKQLRILLSVGVLLGIVGGLAYLYSIGALDGGGDYSLYFVEGGKYAESSWLADFDPWIDSDHWLAGNEGIQSSSFSSQALYKWCSGHRFRPCS